MNPRVEFSDDSQVLDDLKAGLPSATFRSFSDYDVVPVISHRLMTKGNGDEHRYELTADIKNVGNQRIT